MTAGAAASVVVGGAARHAAGAAAGVVVYARCDCTGCLVSTVVRPVIRDVDSMLQNLPVFYLRKWRSV